MASENDIADVRAVLEAVWRHFAEQDPDAMLALLDDSCTIWDIFQPALVTKSTLTDYVAKDFDQSAARGKLTYSMDNFVIEVWDDTALARFYLTYDYQPPNPAAGTGRITVVLRRFPQGWRFVHVHEGQVPAGIPPVDEA
jgi:ketosteroid isomerase-like protein